MSVKISTVLVLLCASAHAFPRNAFESVKNGATEFEASGAGSSDEPVRGSVRVVKVGPHFLRHAGMFRSGASPPRAASPSLRGAFPDFLSLGRAGPSAKLSVPPLVHLRESSHHGADAKRRQGVSMWQQRVMDKSERGKEAVILPINPKDASKQSCAAVPFTQRVTAAGCDTVTVHNRLCFGQCSSMFVPPAEDASLPATGHRGAPCSRCAPSKAHSVTVPLRCGHEVRLKRVMVVEECKCETGREEQRAESVARRTHL